MSIPAKARKAPVRKLPEATRKAVRTTRPAKVPNPKNPMVGKVRTLPPRRLNPLRKPRHPPILRAKVSIPAKARKAPVHKLPEATRKAARKIRISGPANPDPKRKTI